MRLSPVQTERQAVIDEVAVVQVLACQELIAGATSATSGTAYRYDGLRWFKVIAMFQAVC